VPAAPLLVTCDDLGYHPAINAAIVEILAQGIVRSASLMPVGPHFDDAVDRLHAAGLTQVGVHLTLGSEYTRLPIAPLTPPQRVASLVDAAGRFHRDLSVHRDGVRRDEVEVELRAQFERARRTGLRLTHLDGHMFCYEPEVGGPAALTVASALADEQGLPMRRRRPGDGQPPVHMLWAEHNDVAARHAHYGAFLSAYRGPLTELIIHPGRDLAAMQAFSHTAERRFADYQFFAGSDFPALLRAHDIEVIGWADVAATAPACASS